MSGVEQWSPAERQNAAASCIRCVLVWYYNAASLQKGGGWGRDGPMIGKAQSLHKIVSTPYTVQYCTLQYSTKQASAQPQSETAAAGTGTAKAT